MSNLYGQLQATLGDAYRLERELGGGGMSRVFLAHEVALGRRVVIKVLLPELAAGVSVDRFRREIQFAAQLQHPHIVPLLSAGESNGLPFFTMPFIAGETLAVKLARTGELPVNETIRILRDVASALAYAHGEGIMHRDVKPGNVLLSGGVAVVTDFGVAKALSVSADSHSTHLTSLGVALGTPAYMAPEQAAGDPLIDHRADIYALGVVTYEMLAGRTPFGGRAVTAMLAAHVVDTPDPIDKLRPAVPAMLATLVMQCLAKRAADRPQSAGEIMRVLDSISTPTGGTTATTVVVTPPPSASMPSSRRRMVIGGAAAVLILAGAIGGLVRRQHAPGANPGAVRDSLVADNATAGTTQPVPPAAAPDSSVALGPSADSSAREAALRPEMAAPPGQPTRAKDRPTAPIKPARDPKRPRLRPPDSEATRPRTTVVPAQPESMPEPPAARDTLSSPLPAPLPTPPTTAESTSPARIRPPPVSAPAPAPPQPPADPTPEIRGVLASYGAAVESQSVDNIRRLYPGMTTAQQRGWEQFFQTVRDVKAQLSLANLDVANGSAEAQVTGMYTYLNTSTRQTERRPVGFHVSFRREAGGWRITQVR